MRKFFGTLVSLIVAAVGLAWEYPGNAFRLLEHIMAALQLPDAASQIYVWFLKHPHLVGDLGPSLLIIGGVVSLLAIHVGPVIYRYLNPLEFYLERDIGTGLIGLQSFPNGPVVLQVRVRTKIPLAACRAWILLIEYQPDGGYFIQEHNERFPCQWSWSGTDDHRVIDLSTSVPGGFNVATVGNGRWGFEPVMPTNILHLLQREGVHRFTVNVTGHIDGKERARTEKVLVDWRGATRPPIVSFEDSSRGTSRTFLRAIGAITGLLVIIGVVWIGYYELFLKSDIPGGTVRHLTSDGKAKMAPGLRLGQDERYSVEINSVPNCESCEDYAEELRQFFKTIPGWKVGGSTITFSDPTAPRTGLQLVLSDKASPTLDTKLIEAFGAAGISLVPRPIEPLGALNLDAIIVVARQSQ